MVSIHLKIIFIQLSTTSVKNRRKLSLSEIFSYGDPTDQKFIENVMLEELSETEIEEFLIEVLDHLEKKKNFQKKT